MAERPVIYILHGDDEFAINEEVLGLESKVGDGATADMNISRIDGKGFSVDSLLTNTQALPFLAERRLVVLTNPLGSMKSPKVREKFLSILENIPQTTGLVIHIGRPLVNKYDKRKGVKHWLQKWSAGQGGRVFEKEYLLPHGPQMVKFILGRAIEFGGEFSGEAAHKLAQYVNENPRLASKEIEKLLVYVDFTRPVDAEDVEKLTPNNGEANVFQMVDALGNKDGGLALQLLHKLLEDDDPIRLFGMVVRQFRMLLLTKELLNKGLGEVEISRRLRIFPFVCRKLISQVRNFTIEALREIYHLLLDFDLSIKTGQLDGDTALDLLVTSLTN